MCTICLALIVGSPSVKLSVICINYYVVQIGTPNLEKGSTILWISHSPLDNESRAPLSRYLGAVYSAHAR